MKTKIFMIAAMAMTAMASCTSDDFTGTTLNTQQQEEPVEILFNSGSSNLTRADIYGSAAADLLGKKFRVYGTKGIGASTTTAFDNYVVEYNGKANDKDDPTNTHGWTYLGETSLGTNPAYQTIKYWDFSEPEYNFVAFAGIPDNKLISSTVSNTIDVDQTNMQTLFISDRVTAKKEASTTGTTDNMKYAVGPVTLNFRRIAARVRLGIYETVPGYAVKDVRFYYDDNYLAQAGTSTKTVAGLRGAFPIDGRYVVSYDANNEVAVTYYDTNTANHFLFGELDYTTAASSLVSGGNLNADGTVGTTGDAVFLSTTSALPTFAKKEAILDGALVGNSDWQPILPWPANNTNLVLRADFTLVSVDGVGAPIYVKGASAVVPAAYAQWKPNYAYTYIFKISDKTNGTTGEPDPTPDDPDNPNPGPEPDDQGLYPITFDATVSSFEDYQQETITGITYRGGDAITTYSKTSDVTNNNEYKVGETIVVSSISRGRWAVAYTDVEPTTEQMVAANNNYTYTILAGAATPSGTINQNAATSAEFNVEHAGYYIVWLRYLPYGFSDIDEHYINVFKVVKTVD
jgi:hypothetical protein